jgi:hypothetical protein
MRFTACFFVRDFYRDRELFAGAAERCSYRDCVG